MSEDPYILQADGRGHLSDVRYVSPCIGDPSTVFTASRDNTAKRWSIPFSGDEMKDALTFVGHRGFVNFVLYHPGIPLLDGEPCVVTGSNDQHIVLWNPETSAVEALLDGHNQGVCCGAIMQFNEEGVISAEIRDALNGDIVSGDWGGLCIVFDHVSGRPKQLYDKHTTAIRGVAQLTNTSQVVSCSGDKTIHLWDAMTGNTLQIFYGHMDVVQCICAISSEMFATGSNDSTIRLWKAGTEGAVEVLVGHESLVYSVHWSTTTNELLSSSEDHSTRIWKRDNNGSMVVTQVIQHPSVVWGASSTSGGQVLTCSSDHVVRLWTRNYEMMASIEKLELLQAAIESQTIDVKVAQSSNAAAAAGGLDVSAMPYTHEIHTRIGQREGERLFARNESGEVEMYVWNHGRWEKVGVVVAGPDANAFTGSSQLKREKHFYNGQYYDYLFDVDVEGKPLKLPYNVGDSIFETAKNFITTHAGAVAQDSQEEIQNFLLAHINPEDIQKIPGLENTAMPTPEAPRAAVPAAVENNTPQEDRKANTSMSPWEDTESFTVFNGAGAQTKVNALLVGNTKYSGVMELLTVSPLNVALCSQRLSELFHDLPSGSRFPAIDAMRHLLTLSPSVSNSTLETVLAALVGMWGDQTSSSLPASDGEMLVSLRLAASVFDRLYHSAAGPPKDAKSLQIIVWFAKELPSLPLKSGTPSTNIKAAKCAIIQNASLWLSRQAVLCGWPVETQKSIAEAVVRQIAMSLVLEVNGSSVALSSLRSLCTLLCDGGAARGDGHQLCSAPWYPSIMDQVRRSLSFSLQSIATGAAVEGQATAQRLLDMIQKYPALSS